MLVCMVGPVMYVRPGGISMGGEPVERNYLGVDNKTSYLVCYTDSLQSWIVRAYSMYNIVKP